LEIKEIISSGLLELYATGLASEQEKEQVKLWVAQYPEVANELSQIENSLEAYSKSYAIQPDASVKEKLFFKIKETAIAPVIAINSSDYHANKKNTGFLYWKIVAAALLLLLIGSVIINISLYNKNNTTSSLLASTNQQLQSIADKNEEMKQDMQIVQSKYSMPVSLSGLEAAPDAAAKIFWMKNTGEVFIDASNLPNAPSGKNYQLWAFVDGKPVDAGIITAKSGDTYRIQKMKTFGKVEAFAVSLEEVKDIPNTSPQGPVLVMGKM
jgi:anti-sigma-K factor RskA